MVEEPREIETSFAVVCAAVLTGAIADVTGRPVAEVRRRGLDWALAEPQEPRTRSQRAAAAQAWAWLAGAPAVVPAAVACELVGIRLERVVEVLGGTAK